MRRVALGAAVLAVASIGPVSSAFAGDDDDDDDGAASEAYPPGVDPDAGDTGDDDAAAGADDGQTQIPATGNDGSDAWLKLGAGAVLAGGVLVTAAARRRSSSATA